MRIAAWVVLAIALPALAMTYSRAGWMGFAAAAAFLVAAQTRAMRQRATAVAIVVGCAVLAVLLLFNVHHNPSEDYTRISIWQAALQIIDRFPLTGVGPFDFSRLYAIVRVPDGEPSAYHAHSMYLTIVAEMGLVGISAFAWVCWRFALEIRARVCVGATGCRVARDGVDGGTRRRRRARADRYDERRDIRTLAPDDGARAGCGTPRPWRTRRMSVSSDRRGRVRPVRLQSAGPEIVAHAVRRSIRLSLFQGARSTYYRAGNAGQAGPRPRAATRQPRRIRSNGGSCRKQRSERKRARRLHERAHHVS